MQINYTVISTSNYSSATGSTLTVNLGTKAETSAVMAGPSMTAYSFPIQNPTQADIASYAVGASINLTIAPA